jgi:signal transduction histidine kinase
LFSNIVGNSIKYRKKQGPLIINVKMESRYAGKVDVRIQDNGQGFNPQYNAQVFRPFRRLHSSLGCEGNGIGLTICQRIMQELQGEIFAEGEEGVGTTVILRFPCTHKKANAAA